MTYFQQLQLHFRKKIQLSHLLLALLFLTQSISSFCESLLPTTTVNLIQGDAPVDAGSYFYFLNNITEANYQQFKFDDIYSGKFDTHFQQQKPDKFTQHQWFKANLNIISNDANNVLYFPIQALMLHDFQIWTFINGVQKHYQMGFLQSTILLNATGLHFAIPVPSGNIQIIGYLKNGGAIFNMPIRLTTQDIYAKKSLQFENFTFAYYAIFSVLFLYNLSLWISLKENVYGIYLLFIISCCILLFNIDGSVVRTFNSIPRISLFRIHLVNSIFSTLIYSYFAYLSLEQISQWRKIRRLFILLFISGGLLILYNFFNYTFFSAIIFAQIYATFAFLTVLLSLIYGITKKIRIAYYLLIAELGVLIGGSLTNFAPSFLDEYSMWFLHTGFLWEAVFMSLALAEKTRSAKETTLKTLSKYQKIYQTTPQGIFSYNLLNNTYECNNTWSQMHGFNSQEDLNIDYVLNSFAEHIENENVETLISKMRVHEEVSNIIYRPPNPYGYDRKTLILTMRLVKDENGDLSIIEGSGNDITEVLLRKEVEKQKAIVISNSESKNSFFASINHELRTPLTSILGYAQAIQGNDVSLTEKEKGIAIIERSGKHLLQLINDLLDLSKLEAKRLSIEKLQVPIFDIFLEIEDYFGILAKNKNISFDINYHFPLPATIESDPTRFKQILINLCSNALKFTDKGFVQVNVSIDKEQKLLIIKIQDTGIGLTPEQQDNLFQAYSQADQTITRKFGGTGLGLSLSKQLAQLLGGDITLTSTPLEGSTFTLTIATEDLSKILWMENLPSATRKILPANINVPQLSGKILFIEDNQNTRELISGLLRRTKAEVIEAENGVDGLEKFNRFGPFDLVITDINMPGMDGITLCQMIKLKCTAQAIVTISALVNANDLAEYKKYGFSDILQKPVDQNDLFAMLKHYLTIVDSPTVLTATPVQELNVLVAEDNEDSQNIIAIFLTKSAVNLTIVNNGQQALDTIAMQENSSYFDLILMDLQMPVMDGVTAMKILRAQSLTVPIIAFTASDDAKTEFEGQGFDGFLSKPINREKLLDCINRFRVKPEKIV